MLIKKDFLFDDIGCGLVDCFSWSYSVRPQGSPSNPCFLVLTRRHTPFESGVGDCFAAHQGKHLSSSCLSPVYHLFMNMFYHLIRFSRQESDLVHVNDVLDLNNSDLIACTVIMKEGKLKRFLVIGRSWSSSSFSLPSSSSSSSNSFVSFASSSFSISQVRTRWFWWSRTRSV